MNISLEKLPANPEEFRQLLDRRHPENVCAMFLCALQCYLKDPEAGIEDLNLLRGPRPMSPYDIQFLRDRLRGKPYLPLAYFEGATPQNGYTPAVPFTLEVLEDPTGLNVGEGCLKVFLKTAGADSPRPMTLRRKGEEWFLWEYSSILTGIRIPLSADPWA